MPPPATFYTVSPFPYSQLVTIADFNAGTHGTAIREVWFKHVPVVDSIIGYSFISSYSCFMYETDALTLKRSGTSSVWLKMTAGLNYWIKITKGTNSVADFTVSLQQALLNPEIQAGDFVVNDDTNGFDAIVMSVDGVIRGFVTTIPAGETGDSLPSGIQLWSDHFGLHGSKLALSDGDGSFISAIDTTPSIGSDEPHIISSGDGPFYVVNRNGPNAGKVSTVTSGGSVTALADDLNILTNAVGINPDGTILYYVPDSGPDFGKVVKWDLVAHASLGAIYTCPELSDTIYFALTAVNQQPGEILVLSDDTLVTYYQNDTQDKSVLLHLASDGTVLHSYTYSWPGMQLNHIAWAPGDPTYVRAWFYTDGPGPGFPKNGVYQELNINTGVATHSFPMPMFDASFNRDTTSTEPFGPSNSCTMVTGKRSSALEENEDTGTGDGSGGTSTIPTCCDEGGPPGGGDTGLNPDPVGTLPPWMASCTGGGLVDGVADLADGESWL